MKRVLLSVFTVLLSLAFLPGEADAKRLGGGGSSGMKRTTPPPQQAPAVPAKPATPAATPGAAAAAPGAAAAAAPKRSWMGPIAGLAAGLGLAALMSHLGMGEGMANFLMIVLMAAAAFFVIRLLMRRFGPQRNAAPQGLQFAGAGAGAGAGANFQGNGFNRQEPSAFGSGSAASVAAPVVAAAVPSLPEGFDAPAFERIAKLIFIRMQAANDTADLEDLRQFATPEMFATFKLDLQDRKGAAQQTDVVQLDAQVLDFAQETDRQIVSVRFHGLVREVKDSVAEPFDEIWHLVKPTDGSREWAIAGIAQSPSA
jgi:predicted lipid-binding transport protein (Tim44 family)